LKKPLTEKAVEIKAVGLEALLACWGAAIHSAVLILELA
jgi:hypothetical protein